MKDLQFYFGLGWEHIISPDALDHQLFIAVLAVLYLFPDWKKVLILVTAFTLGHSLTLVLSVLDIVRFPGQWVEFLIPCTIFLTAISNLIWQNRKTHRLEMNYYLALCFGLIHGMGFANTIRFMLAQEQNLVTGLLGFNIGLEVGQIMVVLLLLSLSTLMVNGLKVSRRDWVLFLSAGVFSLAVKMALERIPY